MNPRDTVDGNAVVYCEGAYNTPNGKTAHGLVRFTNRYRVVSVIDSRYNGRDAGEVLDGKTDGIPLVASLEHALEHARRQGQGATHFVIGLAPDGGRLPENARDAVALALTGGLNVDCGLHDFLSEDPRLSELARQKGLAIRDIRRPPDRNSLHFFSGKIEAVTAFKVAVLGTDSAVGKRTTAWKIVQGFNLKGVKTEMIGTGQTAWMQGARYCLIMDSLINDFVSGEIEHAIWSAWKEAAAEVVVIEGQGSLMNPAYPGGFEILAAGRPDAVVLQHAPARKDYDGFPGYPIQPLAQQIEVIEKLSGRPVVAVTVNHENLDAEEIPLICKDIEKQVGVPAFDVLLEDPVRLVETLLLFKGKRDRS
ncbi:MAG: hypothetical protein AMJ54_13300 [Deltaproteobacteria bacterium SG8_13]|nr:MAG: hypothetical protein AMJ54_13300 [Deltaproteobacteria bacterium SG8_13]